MALPVAAAFHFAMRSYRKRWEGIDDIRRAVLFRHLDEPSRQRLLHRIEYMISGPGIPRHWRDALTPKERKGAKEAEDEMMVNYRRFQEMGILLNPDGSKPMQMFLEGGMPNGRKETA